MAAGTGGGQPEPGGGGLTVPSLIYRVDPEYSEEARKARFEEPLILETLVRKDGLVDLVHIVRSLGFGLDRECGRCGQKMAIPPGMKNGVPVDVPMRIESILIYESDKPRI